MLEQISWKDFLLCIGGSCAAYYGILIVAGKMNNKKDTFKSATPPTNRKWTPTPPLRVQDTISKVDMDKEDTTTTTEEAEDTAFSTLELLADELQIIFKQHAGAPAGKAGLLFQLRRAIATYPTLDQPAFVSAITNLVIKSAAEQCSINISTQEARELWPSQVDGLPT